MANGWHRRKPATPQKRARYTNAEYRALRKQLNQQVQAGNAYCWRCGHWLQPEQEWHLGHDDHDPTIIRGPEHPHCNRKAAARTGNQKANQRRSTQLHSREWT